jgi:hypothetical protein
LVRWDYDIRIIIFTCRSGPSEPFISLTGEGFRLSAGFVQTHHLGRATAVRLYFDPARRAVGFHFPSGSHHREGVLKPKRHSGGFVIRAQGFFRSRGIDPAKYGGRYRPSLVKDRVLKTLFVIDLRAGSAAPRKKAA